MKFADLYNDAIVWTCYLENFPEPERYLNIYGLTHKHRLMFDNLGRFFPFETFYSRYPYDSAGRGLEDLGKSAKSFVLPWIYWPKKGTDTLSGKRIIVPSEKMFTVLDHKIKAKKIFKHLRIPTPNWCFIFRGGNMIEKPICNSAGGLGIRLVTADADKDCFLEEYIDGCKSIGLQFFIFDEVEFICADEMLFHGDTQEKFRFHAQKNVQINELPDALMDDCLKLLFYLSDAGYKGLIGIDALIGDGGHYLIEINPRGIAFTPAYFAASAHGWTSFMTHMKKGDLEKDEILLLDFGHTKKIVKKTV